jgi:hypothetical protein
MEPWRKLQLQRSDLKKLYNMTVEEYNDLFTQQGGVCAICGKPPTKYRLAVDHCHKTGQIRGLLCAKCNIGVVGLEDPEFARKALAYIGRYIAD